MFVFQNSFVSKMQDAEKCDTKSCKDLVVNNQYAIQKFEKCDIKFIIVFVGSLLKSDRFRLRTSPSRVHLYIPFDKVIPFI
jgi:hypothetical protein